VVCECSTSAVGRAKRLAARGPADPGRCGWTAVGVCGGAYAGVLVGVFGGAEQPPGLSASRPVSGGCGECWIPTKEGLTSV
jgi:hypothetical protein